MGEIDGRVIEWVRMHSAIVVLTDTVLHSST